MLFVRQSGRCLKKWHLRVSSVSHRHMHTHACLFTHGCSWEVAGWEHGLPESRTLQILQGRLANWCGGLDLLSIKCWGLGTVYCVPFSAFSVIWETVLPLHRQSCTGLLSAPVKPQNLWPKNHGDEGQLSKTLGDLLARVTEPSFQILSLPPSSVVLNNSFSPLKCKASHK